MKSNLDLQQLDRRIDKLRPLAIWAEPAQGWIRAIRQSLGMTTRQLAGRLGVSQPRISFLEKAERDGHVTLHSLKQAAAALNCRLVYALVPEKPLADGLYERAAIVARNRLAHLDHTMQLEDQGVDAEARHQQYESMISHLLEERRHSLWDQPDSDA